MSFDKANSGDYDNECIILLKLILDTIKVFRSYKQE